MQLQPTRQLRTSPLSGSELVQLSLRMGQCLLHLTLLGLECPDRLSRSHRQGILRQDLFLEPRLYPSEMRQRSLEGLQLLL